MRRQWSRINPEHIRSLYQHCAAITSTVGCVCVLNRKDMGEGAGGGEGGSAAQRWSCDQWCVTLDII